MHRHALTDEQWERLQKVLPRRKRGPAGKKSVREFIDAVIYRARTGIPWRVLPEHFGRWKTIYNKFARWAALGVWEKVYKELRVRSTRQGASSTDPTSGRTKTPRAKKGGDTNALGRSRGGLSTKIHAVVVGKGRPLHATITAGQRHEMTKADEWLEHAKGRALIGDSGYDSDRFVRKIRRRGMNVVIGCPQHGSAAADASTGRSIDDGIAWSFSSTASSDFAPSPRATTRRHATTSPCFRSRAYATG